MVRYLLDEGITEITVVTRDVCRLKKINEFDDCKLIYYDEIQGLKDSDIVVNCTPLGMYPNLYNSPIRKKYMGKFGAAVDMIYNPKKTLFLKYAEEAGLKAVNGLYMLVGQGVAAEEIWNDIKIPSSITHEIYESMEKELEI